MDNYKKLEERIIDLEIENKGIKIEILHLKDKVCKYAMKENIMINKINRLVKYFNDRVMIYSSESEDDTDNDDELFKYLEDMRID